MIEPGEHGSRDKWNFSFAAYLAENLDGYWNGCKTGAAAGTIREGEIK